MREPGIEEGVDLSLPPPASPASEVAPPCAMVVFGAAGDLTHRLLTPALYNLAAQRLLSDAFRLIGVARRNIGDREFRQDLEQAMARFAGDRLDRDAMRWLSERAVFLGGDLDDASTYRALGDVLQDGGAQRGTPDNALFYMAVPASLFAPISHRLAEARLTQEPDGAWRRVIIEKPFGHDLASARRLNAALLSVLREDQIYRIDHYLGKETVQNIIVLRFANGIFEPLWNHHYVDHVQITVAETVGVEQRGSFYEATGALRDMVPNHLFQLLALTAMEPPTSLSADAVRTEKVKALQAVRRLGPAEISRSVVRGQYGAGRVRGEARRAYRESPNVAADSTTETFVAMKLTMRNWRWSNTPVYLRTGKALAAKHSEIAVRFKRAPHMLFRHTDIEHLPTNELVLRIQPGEGIALGFNAKIPGSRVDVEPVSMDFSYRDPRRRTGYERLLLDCMLGDATLFQRADFVEEGWRIVQPILDAWRPGRADGLELYAAGSDGPAAAHELIELDGRQWRPIGAD
jgi:glucose-6-phosphate 1-dehydrogenase